MTHKFAVRIGHFLYSKLRNASTIISRTINDPSMMHQEITELFGYSELSPEVTQLFINLAIPTSPPEMSICWRTYKSEKWDLNLVFRAKNNFFCDYGPYKQAYSDSYHESFLEELNFGDHHGNCNYPFPLPFNLSFSDLPEIVKKKTKIKTSKLSNASYGSYFSFNSEHFHFVTGFDKNDQLIWIMVKLLELNFKKQKELGKTLKEQNKHIYPLNEIQLAKIRKESPTRNWSRRMIDGDSIFTKKNVEDVDTTLNTFIENLLNASEKKEAKSIFTALKKVVISINKINEQNNGFIETMEREELVEYMHKAVAFTGFKIEQGMDLTEEWREW